MVRNTLAAAVDGLFRTLYRGKLRSLLVSNGFDTPAKRFYMACLSMVSDSQYELVVEDSKAVFAITTPYEYDLFCNAGYTDEQPVITDLLSNIRSDDVFYDIGAHVGLYSLLVADKSTTGSVVAFEPNPRNAEKIAHNAVLNEVDIRIEQYALSDSCGSAVLSLDDSEAFAESRGYVADQTVSGTDGFLIDINTVDHLLDTDSLPPPDVVKIDVEGHELHVLQGMVELLSRADCRLIYCECHPTQLSEFDRTSDDITQLLASAGYTIHCIHRRQDQLFLKAELPE